MRKLFLLGLASVLCLGANAVHADLFDVKTGTQELQLQGPPGSPNFHRNFLDRKICYAIENQKKLEVFIGSKEDSSSTETKVNVKRVVIEPYLFGIGPRGQPILTGNVVSSEIIKEVTIKFSDVKYKNEEMQRRGGPGFRKQGSEWSQGPQGNPDDQQNNKPNQAPQDQNRDGSTKSADVTFVRVLDNEKFNLPKDINKQLDKYNKSNIQVVCSVNGNP